MLSVYKGPVNQDDVPKDTVKQDTDNHNCSSIVTQGNLRVYSVMLTDRGRVTMETWMTPNHEHTHLFYTK